MTDSEERAIGVLEGKVEFLTETWQRQDAEAARGRQRLYEKVDAMIQEVVRLRERLDMVTTDLAALKPDIKSQDQQHHQAIGSKRVIATVWAGFIAIMTLLTTGMVKLLDYFLHLPPGPPPAH